MPRLLYSLGSAKPTQEQRGPAPHVADQEDERPIEGQDHQVIISWVIIGTSTVRPSRSAKERGRVCAPQKGYRNSPLAPS